MRELRPFNSTDSSGKNVPMLIQKSAFFSEFDEQEIKTLSHWMKVYVADTGCVILNEGDKSNCFCIIIEGKVNIFKELPYNEQIKIAEVTTGESIGEMGIIDGEPFSASAIASENSIVLLIAKTDFEMIVSRHHQLGNKLLWKIARVLTERLRNTTNQVAALLTGKH